VKDKRIRKKAIYLMVAKSLAVGTLNHSAKRITEAVRCCFKALREDGFYVETDDICVSKVQNLIDKEIAQIPRYPE